MPVEPIRIIYLGDPSTPDLYIDDYTSGFGGTSGASAIIAGVALIVQGAYKKTTGSTLTPLQMRRLLSETTTGTHCSTADCRIGVMPDLQLILRDTLSLVPDVYLRNNIDDDGTVPYSGNISSSPDIIVRSETVDNPVTYFGENSGRQNSNSLGSTVYANQDNFIYVRMKNRGMYPAVGVRAKVYWSEVSTLLTPDNWNLIGETAPVDVPDGDTLVVAGPITWPRGLIHTAGPYCFIAILDHPRDPAPLIPTSFNYNSTHLRKFIKHNNNVAARNLIEVVVDTFVALRSASYSLPFHITGTPDRKRSFDFEIIRKLPGSATIWLEVPPILYRLLKLRNIRVKPLGRGKHVQIPLPRLKRVFLSDVALPRNAKFKCRFIVENKAGLDRGVHHLAICQRFKGEEVGRVTWAFDPFRGKKEV